MLQMPAMLLQFSGVAFSNLLRRKSNTICPNDGDDTGTIKTMTRLKSKGASSRPLKFQFPSTRNMIIGLLAASVLVQNLLQLIEEQPHKTRRHRPPSDRRTSSSKSMHMQSHEMSMRR
jgi:hypothetical protein